MKMRRVTIQLEVETNIPVPELRQATLTIHRKGPRDAWHLQHKRDGERIAASYPDDPIVVYLENNVVNVIRESTKKRGKRK